MCGNTVFGVFPFKVRLNVNFKKVHDKQCWVKMNSCGFSFRVLTVVTYHVFMKKQYT